MEATVMIHQFPVLPLFPARRRHTAPAPAPGRRPVASSDKWRVSRGRRRRPGVDSGVHAHAMLCALAGTQPWAEATESPNTAPPNRAQLKPSSGPFLWRSNATAKEVLNTMPHTVTNKRTTAPLYRHARVKRETQDSVSRHLLYSPLILSTNVCRVPRASHSAGSWIHPQETHTSLKIVPKPLSEWV